MRGHTVKRTVFFRIPRGNHLEESTLKHYLRITADTQRQRGLELDRVLRVWQSPEPVLDEKLGIFCDEYNLQCEFKSEQTFTIKEEVSDREAQHLLTKYPDRFNERMFS